MAADPRTIASYKFHEYNRASMGEAEAGEPRVRPHWRRRIVLIAVAEGIVVVALLLLVGRLSWPEKPRAHPLLASSTAREPPDPAPSTVPTLPAPILASALPPPSPPRVVTASPSTSTAPAPKLPEHVAELDAFFDLPPESASWTPEQRKEYFDDALRKLDDKDRSLTRQLDLARRRGDTEAADQLAITLEHFRSRGSEIKKVYAPDAGQ